MKPHRIINRNVVDVNDSEQCSKFDEAACYVSCLGVLDLARAFALEIRVSANDGCWDWEPETVPHYRTQYWFWIILL